MDGCVRAHMLVSVCAHVDVGVYVRVHVCTWITHAINT